MCPGVLVLYIAHAATPREIDVHGPPPSLEAPPLVESIDNRLAFVFFRRLDHGVEAWQSLGTCINSSTRWTRK